MITPAIEKDGADILKIAANSGVFDPIEVETVAELWNEFMRKGPEPSGYHFIVSRENDHLSGFACFGPRALTEGTYDLYWIAVDPGARRGGVGKSLLNYIEQAVTERGGRLIFIETSGLEMYVPTRRFYTSAGYEQEASIRDFYKPGDDLVIFTKHLSGR